MSIAFGQVEWQVQLGDFVSAMAVSPDGGLIAAGSLAGDVRLIDTERGVETCKLREHALGVLAIAWSPDGERVAVGGQDNTARVYDRQGRELGSVIMSGWAGRLTWSPVDDLLAIGGGKQLVLTDRDGGVVRRHEEVASTISGVAWATNGRRVGVIAYGGISWYDPDEDDLTPRRSYPWKGSLLSLATSPDGKWACAGTQEASIRIWKLWSGDELAMSGYPSKIERMAFRPTGRWLACACLAELTCWDFGGKGPQGRPPTSGSAHSKPIESLAWQPDGDALVTGGADGRLTLWRAPSSPGQTMRPRDVDDATAGVSVVVWQPDGTSLLVGRDDGTVERRYIFR